MDEKNKDQPLSSEEMLRRARQGLGDSEPVPKVQETPGKSAYDLTPSYTPEFETAPEPPSSFD